MRLKEAIKRADALRPNTIEEERKAGWVNELEGRVAQTRGEPAPEDSWPGDSELTMPPPFELVYERYLSAMIDLANEDTGLYANDMAVFERTWQDAIAWWRRGHPPGTAQGWGV